MEAWRKVFREGFAPLLSNKALLGLKSALEENCPRLIQGRTTCPHLIQGVQDQPVEEACAVAYCGIIENGGFLGSQNPATVEETKVFFARMCFKADQRLGELAGCRHFLNWFDETPREECFRKLSLEIEFILSSRGLNFSKIPL